MPENTVPAFAAAVNFGAGIECDLRLTADDRIIVFHDSDARRLCGSGHKISSTMWRDLAELRISGHPVPSLEAILETVSGRVPLLLEIKVERDLARWAPVLRRGLGHYAGKFGLLSFDPGLIRLMKAQMPGVPRGLNVSDRAPSWHRRLYISRADPDFLGVEMDALGKDWVKKARSTMPVYSWTIRSPADRAQAEVHSDALIWEGDGRPRI